MNDQLQSDQPSRLAPHPLDGVALIFGVLFATVGAAALGQQLHWFTLQGRTWLGVGVVGIGLAGVAWVISAALRPTSPPRSPVPDRR